MLDDADTGTTAPADLVADENYYNWHLVDPKGGLWWPKRDVADEAALRAAYAAGEGEWRR